MVQEPQLSPETRGTPSVDAVAERQYPHEWRRISFLCARDGIAGAGDYCARTSRIYRSAVLTSRKRGHAHPHFASLPEYRAAFIRSYLDFKRFALTHGRMSASSLSPRAGA
jgi:hypothetical protein